MKSDRSTATLYNSIVVDYDLERREDARWGQLMVHGSDTLRTASIASGIEWGIHESCGSIRTVGFMHKPMYLVEAPCTITALRLISWMLAVRYRPAMHLELSAFGRSFPEVFDSCAVVALGAVVNLPVLQGTRHQYQGDEFVKISDPKEVVLPHFLVMYLSDRDGESGKMEKVIARRAQYFKGTFKTSPARRYLFVQKDFMEP